MTPTAQEIIERVKALYAGCRSYEDTGERTRVMIRGPKPWHRTTTRQRFNTAFIRDASFRFEGREVGVGPEDEWPRSAVWLNSRGVFRWDSNVNEVPREITKSTSALVLRIAFVGIVNEPSAYKIPSLLLPELAFRQPWSPASEPMRVDEAHLDGVACFVIDSTFQDRARRSWIEQEALLVRRISDRTVFDERSRQNMISSFESELASSDLEA